MDAADCRLVAGVAERLIGEVLLDARSKPSDQRSSSFRPVIWRSVAELMAGMLWQMTCHGELLRNQLVVVVPNSLDAVRRHLPIDNSQW